MKLFIHDLTQEEFKLLYRNIGQEDVIIDKTQKINNCMGCFGCWVKTPATCVIKDAYMDIGKLIARCDELIIISRCLYGGYSPFIKNVLDRSISYLLPYFTIRNGEMHHKSRYAKKGKLSVYFYGEDLTEVEKNTAIDLVNANALNFNMISKHIFITKNDSIEMID